MKTGLNFILPVLTFMSLLISNGPTVGQIVNINGDNPRQEITVNIEEAGIADILLTLGEKYKFQVSGQDNLPADQQISITLKGNLSEILSRLLKNRNHLIIRSSGNISGIEKIVILQEKNDQPSDDDDNTPTDFQSRFSRSPQE